MQLRNTRISMLYLYRIAVTLGGLLSGCTLLFPANTVEVELDDGQMVVSPSSVRGGNRSTTFKLSNVGSEAHEFIVMSTSHPLDELPIRDDRVSYWEAATILYYYGDPSWGGGSVSGPDSDFPPGIGQLAPGERKEVVIGQSGGIGEGPLVLLCNFPGHYQRGEYATFVIEP
jgi:uncharacterized cupredoxin-like copper-binding protein